MPKTIYFDLPKTVDNKLKQKIGFKINHNRFLVGHTLKNEISQFLSKNKHEKNIHEHKKQ